MKTACKGASKIKKRGTKMLRRPQLVNNTMAKMIHQHTGCVAIASGNVLCCTHFFVSAVVILHTLRLKFIFYAPWKEDDFCCIFADSVDTEREWNLGIIYNCYESQGIGRQRHMPHFMFSLVTRGVLSSLEPLLLRLYLLASDKYLDISLTFPSIYISFFTLWELID